MPAGQLPPDLDPGAEQAAGEPSSGQSLSTRATADWLTVGGAGCLFFPMLLLAMPIVGSRCPLVWGVGGLIGLMVFLLIWPLAAFVIWVGDSVVHPSNDFRGSDVETIRNRRVRSAIIVAMGLAIGIPLLGAVGRPNLDSNGLPISATPAEMTARPEVQLTMPGATSYYQDVLSSMCTSEGDVYSHYATNATPDAVVAWYGTKLQPIGWKLQSQQALAFSRKATYVKGTREKIELQTSNVPFPNRAGKPDNPPPGAKTLFEVWYSLGPASSS